MNWIPLEKLNAMRFSAAPRELTELQRWCRCGALPAKKIGGKWFVDLEAFDRPTPPKSAPKHDPDALARSILDGIRQEKAH